MEGVAIKFFRLEIHIWRPVDTFFRQITARRNPNMAILTASWIFGRPDLGFLAIAVWTVVCLVLHGIQLVSGDRRSPEKQANYRHGWREKMRTETMWANAR